MYEYLFTNHPIIIGLPIIVNKLTIIQYKGSQCFEKIPIFLSNFRNSSKKGSRFPAKPIHIPIKH